MSEKNKYTKGDLKELEKKLNKNLREGRKEKENVHKFWNTQPVLQMDEKTQVVAPIEKKKVHQVREKPFSLPAVLEWYNIKVEDDNEMKQLFELLRDNYVEDDDSMFRFAYPVEFLRWALTPPGFKREWHAAVRMKTTKKLVAFISGIPGKFSVNKPDKKRSQMRMVEINFLCCHKMLRGKGFAPLLIKEITRRVNLNNIWQAVYTAGIKIPKPISTSTYYHRSINVKKLVSVGFSRVRKIFEKFSDPLKMTEKLFKLPDRPLTRGFRTMKEKDVKQVYKLLHEYLKKFDVAPEFSKNEVAHWCLPTEKVVESYVVEDPETQQITDFISFYAIPSTIIGNKKYHILKAAYLFYYVPKKTKLVDLTRDAIIMAKQKGFDVFNCLDILDNKQIFEELKFGMGDGHLYYYFFNYKCPDVPPEKIGIVML